MTLKERDALIMQRCLARAHRKEAVRQRSRAAAMRADLLAAWRRINRT